jgi:hypothetical protein
MVTYGTGKKSGYYELCPYEKVVYRRVELPEWISAVLDDPQRKEPLLSLFKNGKRPEKGVWPSFVIFRRRF